MRDRTTDWVHYGARYYNTGTSTGTGTGTGTGTRTRQDTLDPLDANRYACAGGDPTNNIDPTGLSVRSYLGTCAAGAIEGIVFSAATGAISTGIGTVGAAAGGCVTSTTIRTIRQQTKKQRCSPGAQYGHDGEKTRVNHQGERLVPTFAIVLLLALGVGAFALGFWHDDRKLQLQRELRDLTDDGDHQDQATWSSLTYGLLLAVNATMAIGSFNLAFVLDLNSASRLAFLVVAAFATVGTVFLVTKRRSGSI